MPDETAFWGGSHAAEKRGDDLAHAIHSAGRATLAREAIVKSNSGESK